MAVVWLTAAFVAPVNQLTAIKSIISGVIAFLLIIVILGKKNEKSHIKKA